jgi:hypothetical protein
VADRQSLSFAARHRSYQRYHQKKIAARKKQIAHLIQRTDFHEYPRDAVREVLDFWKINLSD